VKISIKFVFPLADLVLDAVYADILEVDLLGIVALDFVLEFYEVVQFELVLLFEVQLAPAPLVVSLQGLLLGLLLEFAVEGG
jgi:hypothetical protein